MDAGVRASWTVLLMALCAACESAAPDPEAYAARLPSEVDLTPTQSERLRVLVEGAFADLEAGRPARAEERAREALDLDPRAARARVALGACLQARAAEQAPPDFRLLQTADGETLLALRLAPADPLVGLWRARFLERTEHLSAAAEVAEQVLERCVERGNEEFTDLLSAAAELRFELGEEHAARPHLVELVDRRPEDAAARFRLAMCHLKIGESVEDFDSAVAEFAACAQGSPDDQEVHLAIGRASLRGALAAESAGGEGAKEKRQERLEAALTAYRAAGAKFPGNPTAWFGQGVVLEELGRGDDAAAAYEQAIKRDPEHMGALLNLGALLAATEQPEHLPRAEAVLRRALVVGGRAGERLSGEERRRIEAWLKARQESR